MSGGHWNYMQQKFDEAAEGPVELVRASLRLLGQIEHELDWGHASDTCLECARRRVLAALDRFFDDDGETEAALALLHDKAGNMQLMCDLCVARAAARERSRRGSL